MYTMKRQALVNSATSRNVRQRSNNPVYRMGVTVTGENERFYLPREITDLINATVHRSYDGTEVANIQGVSQNRQRIHPFGEMNFEPTENVIAWGHWGGPNVFGRHNLVSTIQPPSLVNNPIITNNPPSLISPPNTRGPGGKRHREMIRYSFSQGKDPIGRTSS